MEEEETEKRQRHREERKQQLTLTQPQTIAGNKRRKIKPRTPNATDDSEKVTCWKVAQQRQQCVWYDTILNRNAAAPSGLKLRCRESHKMEAGGSSVLTPEL